MLVMTRKPGDSVSIGDGIVVKIMEIKGGRVQLGIQAPKDVKIATGDSGDRPQIDDDPSS
jgi:carbon storage regulator